MPILVAAVVLVGLLSLLNLLLSLAIIRRLRGLEAGGGHGDPTTELLAEGTPLPAFPGRPDGVELIALLSTTCSACRDQLPALAGLLDGGAIGREAALVVVVGDVDDPAGAEYADALDAVATVRREPFGGPVSGAFGARIFPVFYRIDGGVVRTAAIAVDAIAEPARA
ncbi:hypothetical protein I0C86_04315 [Plantactinospora sp. S1510]|uniref:Thioredoxin domain-containing protein n=1 Tax=Plantactinospora alkalitolerans TaxID=2789879 RepID=A0ABS0GQ48_9ACTN|nr:hypothetical protein [Plantactinospora alkalitolerans]MBF9128221.1 hypothetical protein [Plantactinospora alkalitolerans]